MGVHPVFGKLKHTLASEGLDADQHIDRPVDALAPGPLLVELLKPAFGMDAALGAGKSGEGHSYGASGVRCDPTPKPSENRLLKRLLG
ncbi:hypothetical protein [Actinomadura rudentiformis]|uniref:Uncharacterized protein n=1 Tax=Actinomadura rudentiformis TaxID=359158 RepID=A0A6H9YZK6_9ACTN|nr:hypothetical protein [Actinomadura rudentiformis]KAB2352260.1 hypothetical protein F8566_00705 [Actinomadura rudentiformis]